jgi:metal-responsive CopG/Arc/MetJ family transcriptional regulator
MNTTINISLPKDMHKDIKKAVRTFHYRSISDFVIDAIEYKVDKNPKYTVNGFTPEFEEMVLKAEKEPIENDTILEPDEDIKEHLDKLLNVN